MVQLPGCADPVTFQTGGQASLQQKMLAEAYCKQVGRGKDPCRTGGEEPAWGGALGSALLISAPLHVAGPGIVQWHSIEK